MTPQIAAGQLRHVVELQQPNKMSSRDAKGQRITNFVTQATVRARVEPITGREQFIAAQMQATTTHLVTLRYGSVPTGMDGSWRIKWGERIFIVDSAPRNLEERNIVVQVSCTEGPRKQ